MSDEICLDAPDPKLEAALDAQYKRTRTLCWKVVTGYLDKVMSFLSALKGGKTTKEIAAERLAICDTCPGMKIVAGRKFCKACSCGTWMLAQLDGGPAPKLEWADVKCPLRRW